MVLKMPAKTTEAHAEAMGRRAGRVLRHLGIPSRCPFDVDELRKAWARGYVAGQTARR